MCGLRFVCTYLELPDDVSKDLCLFLQTEYGTLHSFADERDQHDSEGAQSKTIQSSVAELTATEHVAVYNCKMI